MNALVICLLAMPLLACSNVEKPHADKAPRIAQAAAPEYDWSKDPCMQANAMINKLLAKVAKTGRPGSTASPEYREFAAKLEECKAVHRRRLEILKLEIESQGTST